MSGVQHSQFPPSNSESPKEAEPTRAKHTLQAEGIWAEPCAAPDSRMLALNHCLRAVGSLWRRGRQGCSWFESLCPFFCPRRRCAIVRLCPIHHRRCHEQESQVCPHHLDWRGCQWPAESQNWDWQDSGQGSSTGNLFLMLLTSSSHRVFLYQHQQEGERGKDWLILQLRS